MKKQKIVISALMSVFLSAMPMISFASLETDFNSAEKKLSYSGEETSEYVKIVVTPKNILPENIAESDINSGNVIVKTDATGADSTFGGKIVLPDSFSHRCYIVTLTGDEETEKRLFVFSDNDAVNAAEEQMKNTDDPKSVISANIGGLGFDSEIFEKYGEKISDICAKYVENGLNLTDAYMTSEGIVLVQNGELPLGEMLKLYADFTEFSYELYTSESEKMQNAWEKTAKAQNYGNESLEETLERAKILALFNTMGRDAAEDVIAYFEAENVDMSDYNELSEYYQGKVFSAIAGNEYTDFDELVDDFYTETENQLEEEKDKTSSSGGSGGGGGGSSSSKAGNLAFAADSKTAETAKITFFDTANHWGEADIKEMAAKGIINGFDDGNFRPDQKITRAEFTKLIAGLLKLPEMSGNAFSDVSDGQWFAPFVYSAKDYGLINGISDTLFAPHESITREDAAVILERVLSKHSVKYDGKASFDDENDIADYAKSAVLSLAHGEIIRGADGKFNPKNNLTRAEAAALLCRISKIIE